jgi:hypothetical protein
MPSKSRVSKEFHRPVGAERKPRWSRGPRDLFQIDGSGGINASHRFSFCCPITTRLHAKLLRGGATFSRNRGLTSSKQRKGNQQVLISECGCRWQPNRPSIFIKTATKSGFRHQC